MSQANKIPKSESGGITHALKVSVPDSWQVVPLEEVLEEIVGGGTPSRDNPGYWNGAIPWLTVKDMRTRRPADSIDHISEKAVHESATNIIPADTVIIATRIGLGKVIRVSYDAAINQDLKALITKPVVDRNYLEYWIYSIASYLESIGSGTTVKGIRLEHVRSLPFPLAPLDQQKLIVAEIEKQFSRLDEAVANLKRVKANIKRYKAAVLKAAVEGRLVETEAELARREGRSYETGEQLLQRILETRRREWKGKGKYKEPAAPDVADLPKLPKGWVWATLGELCGLDSGEAFKKSDYSLDGMRLLQIANVGFGQVEWEQQNYLPPKFGNLFPELLMCLGDIVLALNRPIIAERLKVACVTNKDLPAILYQRVGRLRPASHVKAGYLFNYLQSPAMVTAVRQRLQGTDQPYLNTSLVPEITIPLPPEAEQCRIITEVDRRLSVIQMVGAQIDTNLKRGEHVRQSILSAAFSGVLTEWTSLAHSKTPERGAA